MVTVLRFEHLKIKINDNDHNPPHAHIEGGGASVRVNLITLEVMDAHTEFSKSMILRIIEIVKEYRSVLLMEWEKRHG